MSITEVRSNGRIIRIPSHGNPFRVASRRNKVPHVLAIDGDSYRWNRDSREGGLISAHQSATSRPLGDSSVPCRTCLHLLIRLSLSDSLGSYLSCHSPPAGHRPFASPGFHYSARCPSTRRRKACGWTKREIGDRTTVRRCFRRISATMIPRSPQDPHARRTRLYDENKRTRKSWNILLSWRRTPRARYAISAEKPRGMRAIFARRAKTSRVVEDRTGNLPVSLVKVSGEMEIVEKVWS